MNEQGFGDLLSHTNHRIDGNFRFLHDHGDLAPSDPAHFCFFGFKEVPTFKVNGPLFDPAGGIDQAQNGTGGYGLSASGLAGESQRLLPVQMKRYPFQGMNDTPEGIEADSEIFNIKQQLWCLKMSLFFVDS